MGNLEERVARLEENVKRVEGIETRLRAVERSVWLAFGAVGGLQLILEFFKN
jgi:hypothetical protein